MKAERCFLNLLMWIYIGDRTGIMTRGNNSSGSGNWKLLLFEATKEELHFISGRNCTGILVREGPKGYTVVVESPVRYQTNSTAPLQESGAYPMSVFTVRSSNFIFRINIKASKQNLSANFNVIG